MKVYIVILVDELNHRKHIMEVFGKYNDAETYLEQTPESEYSDCDDVWYEYSDVYWYIDEEEVH